MIIGLTRIYCYAILSNFIYNKNNYMNNNLKKHWFIHVPIIIIDIKLSSFAIYNT